MEINISRFFEGVDASEFSASVAELGQDAGKITWDNARSYANERPLLTSDAELNALRDHMRGFGAWEDDEIAGWDKDECNALLVQLISGDIREAGLDTNEPDWQEYEEGSQAGQYSGRMFCGVDGQIYYYLGD